MLRSRPDQFDRAIGFYRESVLPAIETLSGFCSASLMIDDLAQAHLRMPESV